MTTRPAEERDMAAIAALESDIFGGDAWTPSQVADELGRPAHVLVVAEHDGVVRGYGCIATAGDVVDLLRIAVSVEFRRSGLASELLRALRDRAVGADRMLLEVASGNVPAQAFYAAHGFTEIARRRRYYATGEDAVVMAHPLG
jgi:ribosomal-protein-alanine N-acetyltransferase